MALQSITFALKHVDKTVLLTLTVPFTKIVNKDVKKFKMSTETPGIEKSSCVFCNIANKLENTEILYEDEEVCVFRDIKPASDYHILTIPKRHIVDAKCLTSADKNLGTFLKMPFSIGY